MLRIHFIQHWFNLADLACEEALYDSVSLRRFAGIDLGCKPVPDAATLLTFGHLLEQHQLAEKLFAEVGRLLQGARITVKTGTIVDARSLERRARRRTARSSATWKCIRRRKATSGTSG